MRSPKFCTFSLILNNLLPHIYYGTANTLNNKIATHFFKARLCTHFRTSERGVCKYILMQLQPKI